MLKNYQKSLLVYSLAAASLSVEPSPAIAADHPSGDLFSLSLPAKPQQSALDFGSWSYLANKLCDLGVREELVGKIFKDSNLPEFQGLRFNLEPRESRNLYRGFLTEKQIEKAADFFDRHQSALLSAQDEFGVCPAVITATLLVESHFGSNTGKHKVLYRLARLASAADPENMQNNFERLAKRDENVTYQAVEQRAHRIENIFLPQLMTLIELHEQGVLDMFSLRGSSAGAIGSPQFMPQSLRDFARDGDGDGTISLFNNSDSIASIANYYAAHGWCEAERSGQKTRLEEVVKSYNNSDAYAETILSLAERIRVRQGLSEP